MIALAAASLLEIVYESDKVSDRKSSRACKLLGKVDQLFNICDAQTAIITAGNDRQILRLFHCKPQ